jgi:DNA segregation ATPase FtsK/SpoIIIE-like protein
MGKITQLELDEALVLLKYRKDATGKLSSTTSFISRSMGCDYNHAAEIVLTLQQRGIITEPDHNGERHFCLTAPALPVQRDGMR